MDETTRLLSPIYILAICVLAVFGLIMIFGIFFFAIIRSKADLTETILVPTFIKALTVAGVISATTVLALAQVLEGQVVAAILSGIVGYVLGTAERIITSGRCKSNGDSESASPR